MSFSLLYNNIYLINQNNNFLFSFYKSDLRYPQYLIYIIVVKQNTIKAYL